MINKALLMLAAVIFVTVSSPAAARDKATAQLSVQVIAVSDNNPFKSVDGAISSISGIKVTGALEETSRAAPAIKSWTLPDDRDARAIVDAALSGFRHETVAFITDGVREGKTLPLHVGTSKPYVSNISYQTDPQGHVSKKVQEAAATEGLSLSVTPKFQGGKILLDYKQHLEKLTGPNDGFRLFTVGRDTIQLREVSHQVMAQEIYVPSRGVTVLNLSQGIKRGDYFVTVLRAAIEK